MTTKLTLLTHTSNDTFATKGGGNARQKFESDDSIFWYKTRA